MQRKDFLKAAGLLGLTSVFPLNSAQAAIARLAKKEIESGSGCVLIPSETRGPYPLDLSKDSSMFRQAVNKTKTGMPLDLTLTIVNVNDNCNPIPNVRVDIRHCDKDGVYSGFNQPGANTVGQTFCRGIQISDANGQAHFTTVYPGWYGGRVTHIHFEMYLSSVLSATSQLAFPDEINTEVYKTSLYSARGQNTTVTSNSADGVFSDGSQYQTAVVTPNESTGGYDAELTVGIAAKTSGIFTLEPETGGQFVLQQNHPNPFTDTTTIPFTLNSAASVLIELFDVRGRKVYEVLRANLEAGEHSAVIDRKSGKTFLSDQSYVYQITTKNNNGRFCQCKVLTLF